MNKQMNISHLELLPELIIRLFRNKKSYSSFEVLNCIYCCILHFVNQMSCLSLIIKVFVPPDDIISRYYIIAISHGAVKWCKDTTRTSILLKKIKQLHISQLFFIRTFPNIHFHGQKWKLVFVSRCQLTFFF